MSPIGNPHSPIGNPPSAVDDANPWPGLASYSEAQSRLFHGRDEEIIDLTQLAERRPLVVLFGQSGLGKSSILQAGVFPRLRTDGFCPIYVRLDHGEGAPSPTEQIKELVRSETAKAGTWTKPDAAKPGETLWEFFHHRDDRLVDRDGLGVIPVLVFDQFEELFTLGAARGERRDRAVAFMSELAELVENRPPAKLVARLDKSADEMEAFDFGRTDYRVIISLREDFLTDLESLKTIMPALMQKRMRLARMTGKQALEAVVKPGAGLVDDDVARAIVEFVAGARGGSAERLEEVHVEPALLSVVCRELNERRRANGQEKITLEQVSGDRREILNDFYERSVADLPEGMRRFVEDKLLTKSGFRDNLALETVLEEPGVIRELIDTLVSRRLLRIEDRIGTQRVELTHDVLAEVIRASRDARQQRVALAEAAARERRTQRRHRTVVGGLATAVIVLLIGAFFGIRAQRRAENLAREEAAQSSRTDLVFGSRMLEENKTPEGLAFLVRAAGSDPTNHAIGARLISALAYRSFAEPVGNPLPNPGPIWLAWFLPGGRHLSVLGRDDAIRTWDLVSGDSLPSFNPGRTENGTISPDGNRWAIGYTDGTVDIWEIPTGKRVLGPLANGLGVRSMTYSPDQNWLATCSAVARTAKIWNAATGELKAVLEPATSAEFSPDNARLLTAAPGTWRLWRVPTGDALTEALPMLGHANALGAQFSPDGRLVALVYNGGARLYDATTGAEVGTALVHRGLANGAAFSPDGNRFVTTSADTTARIWEVPSGRLLFTLRHGGSPYWPQFTTDGQFLLTGCDDGVTRIWNPRTGQLALEPIRVGGVIAASIRPESNEFLTAGHDQHVWRWKMTPGAAVPFELPADPERLAVVPNLSGEPTALLIYADRLEKIDLLTGRSIGPARRFPVKITQPLLSPDEKSLVVRLDPNTTEIWDLRDRDIRRVAVPLTGTAPARRFSSNSRWLANNSPEGVRVWDVATGALVAGPFPGNVGDNYTPNPFSADGRRVAISNRESVVIYDLPSGQRVGEPLVHRLAVRSPVFSPDGRLIATGSYDRNVQLWEVATTRQVGRPMAHRGVFRSIRFSSDGRRLLTWTRNQVCVWDTATGTPLIEPIRAGNDVDVATFSEDETKIATYSIAGRETRLWDSATGQMLAETIVGGASNALRPPTFHLGGRLLAIGTGASLEVWPIFTDRSRQPVPDWLLRLAVAFAGGEIDRRGNFRELPFDAKVFDSIRAEFAALPKDAPYAEWGRWILADRATRPIGPGFKITAAELEKLRADAAAPAPATAAIKTSSTP